MRVTLDSQILFDEQALDISTGSFRRDSIERIVPGLDGTISIDLGRRGRQIKQKGTLRAKSREQMNDRIDAISAYMDGETHTLVTRSGRELAELRLDSFKVNGEYADGTGIITDYEIVYTQLV